MAQRIWLLVEWVEENNVFPSYSVVNVDTFSYSEKDLQPGEKIYISLKQYNVPRQAKIIKTSDDKQQLKEHKFYLERQDQQVKNVLQVCMRTIKEMKSDQYPGPVQKSVQRNNITGQNNNIPYVITANNENSASDSDSEERTPRNKVPKFANQSHRQNRISVEPKRYQRAGTKSPCVNHGRRAIITSTPVPSNIQNSIVLSFDQGTQTDGNWMTPPTAKLEELELVLKHLYARFQSLIMKVKNDNNDAIQLSEAEHNGDVSYYMEHNRNDTWVVTKNIVNSVDVGNINEDNNGANSIHDVGAIEHKEDENRETVTKAPVNVETDHKTHNENSRVRRMSAQTTYSNELVPIGNGHAMVPARLLNEIDWQSHTTATRQLLQAIFPRKVLATHSLTGKQSPAHRNKPAKKILDPNLVNDIIMIVSSKSGVSKNLVRNTITVKCTDEAKLYRNRLQYRSSRTDKKHHNVENIHPPLVNSSDESTHLRS